MFEQSEAAESSSVTVSVHGPGELIASLPALLGFAPERSVVALAMLRCNDRGDRRRLGPMCRVDLPSSTEQAADLAEAVVARLAPSHPAGVQLIVIDDHTDPIEDAQVLVGPPRAGLVAMFAATFAAAGIECRAPLWVARVEPGGRWRCYESCACEGELPDPGSTTVAATTALAGRVTYRTRDEAAAALAPHPDADSARFRALLDDAHVNAAAAQRSDPTTAALEGVAAVRAAITSLAAGGAPRQAGGGAAGGALEETVMARVAVALGDPAVRDVCLGFAAGRDLAVDAAAAEQLWWRLTRAVPAPEVAQPATLLAFAVLRRGGGAILSVALERAMRADPGHQLSRLLAQIVQAGVHPEVIEQMVLRASAETEALFGR